MSMTRYSIISCACCRYYKTLNSIRQDNEDTKFYGRCDLHDVIFEAAPHKFNICKNWSLNESIDIREKNTRPPRESDSYIIQTNFPNIEEGVLYIFQDPFYDVRRPSPIKPEPYATPLPIKERLASKSMKFLKIQWFA